MSIKANTLWNLGGVLMPLVAAAWAIPVLMRGFGLTQFGVLALLWALIGYVGLFELGLGRTMTVKLAALGPATTQGSAGRSLIQCGLALGLGAGVIGAVVTAATAPWLVGHWLRVPPDLQTDALQAFWAASVGVIPTVGMGVARGALEGTQRFAASNALRMVSGVLGFVLPALSLAVWGPQLLNAATAMVLGRLACWVAALWCLRADWRVREPGLLSHSRQLLGFGGWLTLSSVVGPIMVYGDRFFLGASLSLADVSRYSVVQEMLQRLLVVPTAFTAAWLPALASNQAQSRQTQYRIGAPRFAAVMLAMCLVAGVMVHPVLTWWLGALVADALKHMAWVLCAGIFFNAMAQLPFTLLHAGAHVRATALFHLAQLPGYAMAVWWLTQQWGLVGAALAWTLRAGVDWLGLHLMSQSRPKSA